MGKLIYKKINNSENAISIDLLNGYTVIAISGWQPEKHNYITTLYLKSNHIDKFNLIEKAEFLEFNANQKTINSAILKQVSTYLEEGFFDYYIRRYDYETYCFNVINELIGKEKLVDVM